MSLTSRGRAGCPQPAARGAARTLRPANFRGYRLRLCCLAGSCSLLAVTAVFGQPPAGPVLPVPDEHLARLVDSAVRATVERFAVQKLTTNQLAVTLIDLRDARQPRQGSYRGNAPFYPASVIKLFYLVAAQRWLEDGRLQDTPELQRALHDMIVDSYNEATHYVVDVLTGTTSGPELPAVEMQDWSWKRNVVNRYFAALGYAGINANQKPWCEGPYGRERVFVGPHYENRNQLTTDTTARLLAEIATGRAVSGARSAAMRRLLARDPFGKSSDPDDQAHGFTGPAVPPGGKLWSKAGWTGEVRHDAAYLELPGGTRFVLVTFTVAHANEREIIPFLAGRIITAKTHAP
ncbi:MAG: serine hydrolase [Verrucomicrobia bacterium]|nr:serine hydrolase [Verrucomicrobiota bacterium]